MVCELGHMLERMFEKQSNLKMLSHPFGPSRGIQLRWMQSEAFENGMTDEVLSNFQTEVDKGLDTWRSRISEAEAEVCQHCKTS